MPTEDHDDRKQGERRQVTILFADLVGFTAFSERAGEEAAYTLMKRITKLLRETVHELGGTVKLHRRRRDGAVWRTARAGGRRSCLSRRTFDSGSPSSPSRRNRG